MDFLKALTMGQSLLDALKLVAQIMQANTEATEKLNASNLQLMAKMGDQSENRVA